MKKNKRFFLSVLIFILLFGLLSGITAAAGLPFLKKNDDRSLRAAYAGSLDTLFIGASQLGVGLDPEIIDEALSCNSYVLSRPMLSMRGRYYLLKQELTRNPVKRVVFDVACDALSNPDLMGGSLYILPALDAASERAAILLEACSPNGMEDLCRSLLSNGIKVLRGRLSGAPVEIPTLYDAQTKGYSACEPEDVTLSQADAIQSFHSDRINLRFRSKSVYYLEKMIRLCEEYGAQATIVILPISDAEILRYSNWDAFRTEICGLAATLGVPLYDFNLLKDRYSLFSDRDSYFDLNHMSKIGAAAFSDQLARVLGNEENGEASDDLFFSGYREMEADSPYLKQFK